MQAIHPKHGEFCRDISLAHNEVLSGTAGPKQLRILIQDHSPWSRQGFDNCDLPEAIKQYLKALFGTAKPSIMLVRNNDQRKLRDKSIFIVHSDIDAPAIYHYHWQTPADLKCLPLADAMARKIPPNYAQALYLACTNGKRDKCCAKYGMPLYKQLKLKLGDKVWRSTHIGGDRFAANMLCLPHGLVYGRLTEHSANKAVQYYEQGKLSLEGLRGRSSYSKPEQFAESYVRNKYGVQGLNALVLKASHTTAEHVSIVFVNTLDGSQHELSLHVSLDTQTRKLSCDADKLDPVPRYKVVEFNSSSIEV